MALFGAAKLHDLIIGYLVIGASQPGESRSETVKRWRAIVGEVVVITDAVDTNWRINPEGTR